MKASGKISFEKFVEQCVEYVKEKFKSESNPYIFEHNKEIGNFLSSLSDDGKYGSEINLTMSFTNAYMSGFGSIAYLGATRQIINATGIHQKIVMDFER